MVRREGSEGLRWLEWLWEWLVERIKEAQSQNGRDPRARSRRNTQLITTTGQALPPVKTNEEQINRTKEKQDDAHTNT